jgi:alpha-D-ribose 1-methylphosphonate 5-triphosphate synthase subunit PhnH
MSELSTPPVDGSGIAAVAPGLTDPVFDAQACFRTLLDAMTHPGRIVALPVAFNREPPEPLGVAAAQIALTLCDVDTPVWLDAASSDAIRYLAFHCGATVIDTPAEARFVFSVDPDRLRPLDQFALGSDEYPDRSTSW